MAFPNPYPDTCCFAIQNISLKPGFLHPLELESAQVFTAEHRRAEFLTGRACAHLAMKEAGYPNLPVLRGRNRSPLWPLSIVGSISHGASLAAAIVGKPSALLRGVGLDMEDLSRSIRTNITRHTLTEWEYRHWKADGNEVSRETRIIFSIKETIYKCFQPMDGLFLGFQDAEVMELSETGFWARILKNPCIRRIETPLVVEGKLAVRENIVLSALKFP